MKPIKKINLTKLSLQGFKGFTTAQTFMFENTTLIEADNGKGKSSILEAIVFVFTGCTFWGDNKNNRLMNNGSKKAQVEVGFIDENGNPHTLSRRKTASGTSIAFDGIPVRQTDLIEVFGEKDCFLSMVNPLYFIERMADSTGRNFLLKLLPAIGHEKVLPVLGEYHRSLLEGESLLDPAAFIKNCRVKIRELEDTKTYTQGQLDMLSGKASVETPSYEELEAHLSACRSKLQEIDSARPKLEDISGVKGKKLALKAELDAILQSQPELKDCAPMEIRLAELRGQHSLLKTQKYVSGVSELLTGIEQELQRLRQEWTSLDEVAHSITAGSKCPSCFQLISDAHVEQVKADILKEKTALKALAEPLIRRRDWLLSQDEETKRNFEKRLAQDRKVCEDEMAELSRKLQFMKSENNLIIKSFTDKKEQAANDLKNRLSALDMEIEVLKNNSKKRLADYEEAVAAQKSNLTREMEELQRLKHARMEAENAGKEITRLAENLKALDASIDMLNRKVDAAMEYAARRAELTLKPLKMNRVEIKLQEVIKSTGEIVNTFRFTYDGRDYRVLSLSEKLRAGLEVSGLIQELTGKCYPVLVDNSESITAINNLDIPGQIILTKVMAGAALSVNGLPSCQKERLLPFRKAG